MAVQDGWWVAVGERATFTFQVQLGSVVTAPPYGWALLGGKSAAQGIEELLAAGFVLHPPVFDEVKA